jgi:hypothetical protein
MNREIFKLILKETGTADVSETELYIKNGESTAAANAIVSAIEELIKRKHFGGPKLAAIIIAVSETLQANDPKLAAEIRRGRIEHIKNQNK